MSQPERLQWIDAAIRAEQFPNVKVVQQRFEVSRRTVFGDIRYLRDRMNAPIVHDRVRGGWTYTSTSFVFPTLLITTQEAGALSRALIAAVEFLGKGDAEPLRLLLQSCTRFLPDLDQRHLETVTGAIRPSHNVSIPDALLEDCRRAVKTRQRVLILYYSLHRNEMRERTVRPYHIINHLGEYHLVAWCEMRSAIRQFYAGRIREWTVLSPANAFLPDPDFDINHYRRGLHLRHGEETVLVKARFTPYQARWIRERSYHPTQTIEDLPDGGLVLTLHVAGVAEVRRWLLGYGGEVEVLEPATLRDEIACEAKRLSKIYDA
ncbi:DNA-binding protein [Capsulimonas corticalis]|uniref:DNA-binding protein n=1 Tax=Capsulimonas corticalis TaxID=2219043 RepID=A0A402CWI9_9BACT|nr:WYL domain-containing protein [Capsulimonas corticalis]BDI34134.1 DNA-binding protein [Capsulimonas corticalis]